MEPTKINSVLTLLADLQRSLPLVTPLPRMILSRAAGYIIRGPSALGGSPGASTWRFDPLQVPDELEEFDWKTYWNSDLETPAKSPIRLRLKIFTVIYLDGRHRPRQTRLAEIQAVNHRDALSRFINTPEGSGDVFVAATIEGPQVLVGNTL